MLRVGCCGLWGAAAGAACGVLRTMGCCGVGCCVWGAADCGLLRLLKIEDGRNGD